MSGSQVTMRGSQVTMGGGDCGLPVQLNVLSSKEYPC